MRNTESCWDTNGTLSLQKQPIQAQYIRADPLGVPCRVFAAHTGGKPRLFIFGLVKEAQI